MTRLIVIVIVVMDSFRQVEILRELGSQSPRLPVWTWRWREKQRGKWREVGMVVKFMLFIFVKVNQFVSIRDSIVASIPACHAGDRGSIPRRGE
jgi:hypothetical protein